MALATAATEFIASQATISGTFSVTRQAVQQGYLPRLTMIHTSAREIGQIYIQAVNWPAVRRHRLRGGGVRLVQRPGLSLRHRGDGHDGDGRAGELFFVLRYAWNYLGAVLGRNQLLVLIELVFFSANIIGVLSGGWFLLLIAAAVFTVIWTWKQGRAIVSDRVLAEAIDLKDLPPVGVHQCADARIRHRGVHDGRAGHHSQCADARPQAQQGAARHQPVCHRELSRDPRGSASTSG